MKRVSVLLADDHAMFRQGLRTLLEVEGDIEVVGEAKNGRQAVDLTRKLHPAVVLMDVAMPLLNGLEATRIILDTLPLTKVLMLSAHADDDYVERASELGAPGYLLKQSSAGLLSGAIRDVQKGCRFLCPSNAKRPHDQEPRHNHKKR
jgi:DNA-binding NarL/FixJ family response regulator